MNLNLPPQIEFALSQQAIAAGQSLEAYLRHRLAEFAEDVNEIPFPLLEKSARARRFDEWIASYRIILHDVDDCRESIYAGRGKRYGFSLT